MFKLRSFTILYIYIYIYIYVFFCVKYLSYFYKIYIIYLFINIKLIIDSYMFQNEEERGFKWLWTWNGCWCQTGWSEYLKHCWSTGIFTHNHSLRFIENDPEKEKISSERQTKMKMKMPCWCQRSEETGPDSLEMIECNSNSNNHSLQPRYAEYHLLKHNTSNPEADGLQQQKTTPVPLLSAKNRKRRLQFAQAHQKNRIEDRQ